MNNIVFKPLKITLLGLAAMLALAACNTSTDPGSSGWADDQVPYIATVDISAEATEAELEQMYGGQVQLFAPEAGFAIMGFSEAESELTTLSLSLNAEISIVGLVDTGETTGANGNSAWASGNSAWASGNSAWASGNSAWASGMGGLPSESLASLDMINISQGHALSNNYGEGITVAVIDTGLDLSHPAFEGRLAPTSLWRDLIDYDQNPQDQIAAGANGAMYGHGTAVAGLIAQVAPKAKILPIRVLNAEGNGTVLNLAIGLYYAIMGGADVINVSVGTNAADSILSSFITYAASRHSHVVVASGNAGNSSLDYPAQFANVGANEGQLISVGSVKANGTRSKFSNYGSALEFLAPGEGVFSSYPDNRVGYFSGTSFASPIVAGMIALGLAEAPGTSSFESYLASGAEAVSGWGNGYGIPKADSMLQMIMNEAQPVAEAF